MLRHLIIGVEYSLAGAIQTLLQRELRKHRKITEQLRLYRIDYAFTSHLKRDRKTLEIVLEAHSPVSGFADDRLIKRCLGLLQGKSKGTIAHENPA